MRRTASAGWLEKRDAPDVRSYRIVDGEVAEETVVIV